MFNARKSGLLVIVLLVSACHDSSNSPPAPPVNQAPEGANASLTTSEDATLVAPLNASDPDGDVISISVIDDVVNGTLDITPDGGGGFDASYTPDADFNGPDSFSFTVSDGQLSAGPFTVDITVTPVDDAPVASDAAASVDEDDSLSGTLVATDADGDTLVFMAVGDPGNGTLLVNADGSYVYTPDSDFFGSDQFGFSANDGVSDSNTAVVLITVAAVNDVPVAVADNLATTEDTPLMVAAPGVLANDTDIDGDAVTAAMVTPPVNGALMLNADGSLVYTPNANFNGMDVFSYLINDGNVDSAPATATIDVIAVNDPPVANALDVATLEDASVNVALSGSDVESSPLMFALTTMPVNGTLSGFDAATGTLTYTPNPDFSGADSFTFRVNDGSADSVDALVSITVTPVNDPPISIVLDNTSVDEEQAAGTAIGMFTTTDADVADVHTYALIAGAGDTDNASFAIVGNVLQTAAVFDFETQDTFGLRVQTDDGAGGTFEQAFVITVNDINEPPTAISLTNTSVDENLPAGTTVGTLDSTDPDSAGPFTYALIAGAGDTDNAKFAVVGDQLQTATTFDFETQSTFSVRIQSDDGAGGTFEEVFGVIVNDVNDAPSDITLSNSGVDENLPAGSAVGTFASTDVDTAGPFVYSLVAGAGDTDNASFAIVGDQLQTAAAFDFETQSSLSVRVQTDDGAGGTFEEAFVISVNDINDAPTDIGLSGSSVDENLPAGTAVGTLSAVDVDSAAFTFGLVAGAGDTDNASFTIVGDQLQTNTPFDFETQNSFSVRIQTDDGAGGTFEEAFVVTVNDVNEAPTDIALDSTDVDENQAAGTAVGSLSSTDVDSAVFTYMLVAGAGDTDNGSFGIAGAVLETAVIFDFETQNSFSIRVQTDDGAGGLYEEALTITVNDLNDAPTDIALDSAEVDENQAAGTAVGTLGTTDVDSAAFIYTLVAGAGDTDNASFGISGAVLETAAILDFETQSTYSIRVQTDDGAGGLYEEALTITVNDLNDDPTDIALDSTDVDENQAAGTAVGTFGTTDVDSVAFTYTLVAGAGDTDNASFGIAGAVLETAAVFDFETQDTYSIRVQTDDGAGGLYEEVFTITVNNLNDSPTEIALDNMSVGENQAAGTAVGTFSTTDADALDTHTYTLVAGAGDTDNAQFSIVGAQLQTAAVLDFETAANCMASATTCSIRVQTDDGNGGQFEKTFIIGITDANDDPTDLALSNSSVNENEPVGTPVGTFSTTDEDTADTHTYTLVAGAGDTDNAQFTIVGAQLQTAAVLDFETAASCMNSVTTCSIRVQTDDGNGGVLAEVFIIAILDVLDPNAPPVAVNDDYTGAIGNTNVALVAAPSGTSSPPTVQLVGTVIGNDTDADTGDTLSATPNAAIPTIQGGSVALDADGHFVYAPAAGFPSAIADSFDYEVCDDGTPVMCDTGTVSITGSGMVWYVDDSSANNPGTGTAGDPFRSVASAGGPSLPGDTIFVFAGTQTTGVGLQNNQSLIGEGVALVVNTTTLVNGGTRPVIANAAGAAVMLASGNTVRGLDITGSREGIVGTGFGTLTADSVAISTTGGAGIDLSNGAGSVTFDSLSSSMSATAGIDLNLVTGSFAIFGGAVSGSNGNAVDITSSSATVSYGGTVTAGSGLAVNVTGHSANGVDLSGLIVSTGQGINLVGNAGGTITFRGGLDLDTGSNTGFNATSGGTVNVCADTNCQTAGGILVSNLLATTTAKAINIQNTTIGAGGITFDDVEVTGAATHGIDIQSGGSSGFFTVNGGMIDNTTVNGILIGNTDNITISGMSLTDAANDAGAGCSTVSFNCNAAIELNSVSTVDLSNVTILRSDEHGIFGTNVTDLDLTDVSVTNAGQTSEEHGIFIRNLLGTANAGTDSRFDNVDVSNSGSNGIFIENTAGTTNLESQPDLLTVTGTSSVINHATNSGIIVESDAAVANLMLEVQSGYQSINNSTRGLSANANVGRLQVTVNGATFGGGGHFTAIAGGSAAAGGSSELVLNLTNNDITQSCPGASCAGTGPGGIAFSSFSTGPNNGTMRGTIQGNTISSVAANIVGISLINEGSSTANRFLIDNNNIQLTYAGPEGGIGMDLESRMKQGAMDLVITNNTVNIPSAMSTFGGGIAVVAGNGTSGESNTMCIDMSANAVFTPAMNAAAGGFQLECQVIGYAGNTMEVEGLTAPFTDARLETHLETVNTSCGTDAGITTAVAILGATLTSGNCIAP